MESTQIHNLCTEQGHSEYLLSALRSLAQIHQYPNVKLEHLSFTCIYEVSVSYCSASLGSTSAHNLRV